MRLPFGPLFPAVTVVATILALGESHNYTVAVPAAVVAVAAAAATLADALNRRASPADPRVQPLTPIPVSDIRDWFRSGPIGREELLALIDRLDRGGPHPGLPARPVEQVEEIAALSGTRFREYVSSRLTEIEGPG